MRAAAMSMVCESIVGDVAERLRPAGIAVMPLKGVYLQKTVYRGAPELRGLSDVDLLVRRADFFTAHRRLLAAGYRPLPGQMTPRGCTYQSRWQAHLDLHCALYDAFVFRVRSDALFERGRNDAELYGAPLCLPDPVDLYVHLVGHFAKGRLRPDHPNLQDLSKTSTHFGLSVRDVAERLQEGGLERAARYALGRSVQRFDDVFARAVLDRLPNDPRGDRLARLADRILGDPESPWFAQVLAGHALNTSLPRAALAMAGRTAHWLRQ